MKFLGWIMRKEDMENLTLTSKRSRGATSNLLNELVWMYGRTRTKRYVNESKKGSSGESSLPAHQKVVAYKRILVFLIIRFSLMNSSRKLFSSFIPYLFWSLCLHWETGIKMLTLQFFLFLFLWKQIEMIEEHVRNNRK